MRILVDHSGYDLLNIGDVAMLQSCVTRLRMQWPTAEIMVIAADHGRLAAYCPGTIAIGRTFADLPFLRLVPRKARLIAEQVWKIAGPYLAARPGRAAHPRPRAAHPGPRTAVQAVRAADLMVASGGGYLTDTWWWHAAGVLSLLSLAQRLGKPTAMFGQGIGPMTRRLLRAQSRAVLPGLVLLGLREDPAGRPLAVSLGASPEALRLTGDDAFEHSSTRGVAAAGGRVLGVNLRVAGYAGVGPATAAAVGATVREVAAELGAALAGLPVSRYPADADAGALRALWPGEGGQGGVAVEDFSTPEALAAAAARCRAVVTGSYHAAVFSLAAGVPAVCVAKSRYYDAKFGGLAAQFPGACFTVSLDGADPAARLRAAVHDAWQVPEASRAAAAGAAAGLRDAGREAYTEFRLAVEGRDRQAGQAPAVRT
jgi:colanic acid/amylovoran biosynthesis protein